MNFPQGRAVTAYKAAIYALFMGPYLFLTGCVFIALVLNAMLGLAVMSAVLFFVFMAFAIGAHFVHCLLAPMFGRAA